MQFKPQVPDQEQHRECQRHAQTLLVSQQVWGESNALFPTMHVHTFRKQEGWLPVIDSAVNNTLNSLLFANDQLSGRAFLIDSGAEVSVLPATVADRRNKIKGRSLSAANGSSISTFGKRFLHFQICGNTYEWLFIVASVERPILGADFLKFSSLLVDVRKNSPSNTGTVLPINYQDTKPHQSRCLSPFQPLFTTSQGVSSFHKPGFLQ